MNQQPLNIETVNDWIIGYLTQSLNPEEMQSLQTWISESDENQKYFTDMQEMWLSASDESDEKAFDKEKAYQFFLSQTQPSQPSAHTQPSEQTSIKKKTPHLLRRCMYAAAVVALVLISGTIAYQSGKMEIQNKLTQIIVEAPLGSKTKLFLPDGTLVWLNAGSTLSYAQNFGVNDRHLNLSGEGYFEVTKNKELPFEVCTHDLRVKVLGTKFNFRNYEDDIEAEVCLLEGKVALSTDQKDIELNPDQRALLDKKTGELSVSDTEAAYSNEWTNDFLYFDEKLLPDITKKLERSYNVKITIADDTLRTFRFFGKFRRKEQNIREVMDMLSSTEKMTYTMNGKNIVITRNK